MKKGIVPACIVLVFCHSTLAQQTAPAVKWDSLKLLVGKWVVEVNAEGGQQGSGFASFEAGLQGQVLVRKNHAEYPATKDQPAIVHDDFDGHLSRQTDGPASSLLHTDNDGNVINYTVNVSSDGKSAVFLGDEVPSAPRFRLTYAVTERDRMTFTFELAPPGKLEQFQKFIGGAMKSLANYGVWRRRLWGRRHHVDGTRTGTIVVAQGLRSWIGGTLKERYLVVA